MNGVRHTGCRGCCAEAGFARRFAVCTFALLVLGLQGGCLPKSSWFARTDQAQQLALEARHAQDRQDPAKALHLLSSAVEINPRDCETRIELSEMLLENGSCDAAVSHLRQVVKQNPEDARSHIKLAQAMRKRGDLREAERLCDIAIRLDPVNAEGLVLRGVLYEQQQQDESALRVYYRAMHTNPDRTDAALRIAAIQLRRNASRQAGAVARSLLERTDISAAHRSEAEWMLGLAYSQEQRWNLATPSLKSAADSKSFAQAMKADDWYQLAYASWQTGDLSRADQANAQALRLQPKHAEAQSLLTVLSRNTADARSSR